MSAPTVTITVDGELWSATFAGIDSLTDVTRSGTTPDEAADEARRATQAACLAAAAEQTIAVGAVALAALELRLRSAASLAVAALTPAQVTPSADPYGVDIGTFPDLGPYLSLVSGPRAVAEAVGRRLLTATGLLEHAPDSGFDVRDLLGQAVGPARLAALQARVQTEAEGDERVLSAGVALTFDQRAESLTVEVQIALRAGEAFRLVLTVTQLAFKLEVLTT